MLYKIIKLSKKCLVVPLEHYCEGNLGRSLIVAWWREYHPLRIISSKECSEQTNNKASDAGYLS
jgi:hypothetical protein